MYIASVIFDQKILLKLHSPRPCPHAFLHGSHPVRMHVDPIFKASQLHHIALVLLPHIVKYEVVAEGGESNGSKSERDFSTGQGPLFFPVYSKDDCSENSALRSPGSIV